MCALMNTCVYTCAHLYMYACVCKSEVDESWKILLTLH